MTRAPEAGEERRAYGGGEPRREVEDGHAFEGRRGRRRALRRRRGGREVGQRLGVVLAEQRRGRADGRRRVGELDQGADLLCSADGGIVDLDDAAVVQHNGVVHRLLCADDFIGGDALLLEDVEPLVGGLGEHRRDDHAVQNDLVAEVFPSEGRAGEARIVVDMAQAHGPDPEGKEAGGHVRHLEPLPILAADNHVGEVDRASAGRPRRLRGRPEHPFVDLPPHRGEHVVGGERAVHAGFEVLTEPGALADDERGGDGLEECVDRGPRCVGTHPQRRFLAARLGLELEADPALGLDYGAVRREVGVAAVAGEGDDRGVDEPGIDLREPRRVEAEPGYVTSAGALNQHVHAAR